MEHLPSELSMERVVRGRRRRGCRAICTTDHAQCPSTMDGVTVEVLDDVEILLGLYSERNLCQCLVNESRHRNRTTGRATSLTVTRFLHFAVAPFSLSLFDSFYIDPLRP